MTLRAAVFGASGYTGGELLRYLAGHPSFEAVFATADRNAGKTVGEVFGHLIGLSSLRLEATVAPVPLLDLAFLALPHGRAAAVGGGLVRKGVRVVDLSAAWRLRDPLDYETWYGWTHPEPAQLSEWVYGLPETHRAEVAGAPAVANPGCYPTAAVLALAPAITAGAVRAERIVIDAVSGVSGAGRKVDAGYLFSELDASFTAYGVAGHRHTPEIEQELGTTVTFTPHLAPMSRGLLVTCYAPLAVSPGELRAALESKYKGEPFVHVLPPGAQPATKQVAGTNHALVGVEADERTATAIITCAIDNLGKGAAGQAVQNANIMFGLEETSGLGALGVFP